MVTKIRRKKFTQKLNGKTIKSDFEYEIYKKIESMLPKGATVEYEADKFEYITRHVYIPDFTITFKDGRKIYVEAKGNGRQFDQTVRSKMVAVKDQHPEETIFIVFYADGRIGGVKKRKRGGYYKQSEWASRNGYPFSIKEIPEELFQ
jgi:predicted nuclease of restriction endonuclease-like RecB superfamily